MKGTANVSEGISYIFHALWVIETTTTKTRKISQPLYHVGRKTVRQSFMISDSHALCPRNIPPPEGISYCSADEMHNAAVPHRKSDSETNCPATHITLFLQPLDLLSGEVCQR
jgi:hypothetical protein